jgi:hypothetical protein
MASQQLGRRHRGGGLRDPQPGIWIHGMFVLGSDDDSVETFGATVRLARLARLETGQSPIATPLPGARHYRELEAQGWLVDCDCSRYDASTPGTCRWA